MNLERTDVIALMDILSALPMVGTYDLLTKTYGERRANLLVRHLIHVTLPKLKANEEDAPGTMGEAPLEEVKHRAFASGQRLKSILSAHGFGFPPA